MIICLLVIVFFATIATGPDGRDYVKKRKELRQRPLAKVIPLPYPKGHPRKL